MKGILTLLFLINLTISCAQNEQVNIVGEWKIISVNSGDFYLNTKKDSISFSKHFKEVFTDSLELDNVIKVTKMTYNNNIMEFNDNGIFTQKIDSELRINGTYEVDPSIGKINVLLKENVNWEMDYVLVDEQLHLTTTLYGKKSEFVLEKVKK
ncbi:hypothetical protein [Confluentibacter flavum]|uniref:Lipocalin-like domain-containing protein n=1 Tax=Confluentibacter flavum TaxID=1909700 RepID=A0A2N3HFE7_9FLAO|nr:hypothetical protein [Confluentibacter flavum]PKQ43622.1 hypothetical protein CSW08_16575 [Confluentibacter flavum]